VSFRAKCQKLESYGGEHLYSRINDYVWLSQMFVSGRSRGSADTPHFIVLCVRTSAVKTLWTVEPFQNPRSATVCTANKVTCMCVCMCTALSARRAACRDDTCEAEGGTDDDDNVQDKCCEYFRDSCCSTEENNYLTLLFQLTLGLSIGIFGLLVIISVIIVCCCCCICCD
jgi:hypothetical protein